MTDRNETVADVVAKWMPHFKKNADPHEESAGFDMAGDAVDALEQVLAAARREAVVGNAAKLREALTGAFEMCKGEADCGIAYTDNDELMKIMRPALAAPTRNCDVGTAEEQKERFEKFCEAQPTANCDSCHLAMNYACEFEWAQMPYEAAQDGDGEAAGGRAK